MASFQNVFVGAVFLGSARGDCQWYDRRISFHDAKRTAKGCRIRQAEFPRDYYQQRQRDLRQRRTRSDRGNARLRRRRIATAAVLLFRMPERWAMSFFCKHAIRNIFASNALQFSAAHR